MAVWPKETRDLIDITAADHGELYPAIAYIKKIGDTGSGSPGVELHAGIAPLPEVDPPVQLVMANLTEVLTPHPKCKHGGVAQLSLSDRTLDDVVIAG